VSWLYSRALVEEYSEDCSWDGGQSALLNVMPMRQPFWHKDKTMEFWTHSLFGPMSARLTDARGEALLTSYLAGFHARTSARPARGQALQEIGPGCGWKWRESSVKYDPDTRLWKTRQFSLLEDSESFSETWPRWGSMRDGECWELPMSARPTFARGSGLWPTIRRTDGDRGGRGDLIQSVRGNPNSHYRLWQTPIANDACNRKRGLIDSRGKPGLSAQVKLFPTPMTKGLDGGSHSRNAAKARGTWPTPRTKSKSGGGIGLDGVTGSREKISSEHGEKVCKEVTGGSLNPTWVEWLMGWPIGWTDLWHLETDRSRGALPKPGAC
jgi:hypothetical protein